jgi:hypothetical protein
MRVALVATTALATGACHLVFPYDEVDLPRQQPLAAGRATTCAIDRDNTLRCWGDNHDGQVGAASSDVELVAPALVEGGWARVSLATTHACAITIDGALHCWGEGTRGQLGVGTRTSTNRGDRNPRNERHRVYAHVCDRIRQLDQVLGTQRAWTGWRARFAERAARRAGVDDRL